MTFATESFNHTSPSRLTGTPFRTLSKRFILAVKATKHPR